MLFECSWLQIYRDFYWPYILFKVGLTRPSLLRGSPGKFQRNINIVKQLLGRLNRVYFFNLMFIDCMFYTYSTNCWREVNDEFEQYAHDCQACLPAKRLSWLESSIIIFHKCLLMSSSNNYSVCALNLILSIKLILLI